MQLALDETVIAPFEFSQVPRNDIFVCGARGGRTLTVSLPTDFKSVASADSAIAPALGLLDVYGHPYFKLEDKPK